MLHCQGHFTPMCPASVPSGNHSQRQGVAKSDITGPCTGLHQFLSVFQFWNHLDCLGPVTCFCVQDHQSGEDKQQQVKPQPRTAPDQQQLQALWQHFVVERCLGSSHERKALALQLLLLLVPVMTAEVVPVLLTKQVLGCIAAALKDRSSYLHARAERCMVSVMV